MAGFWERKVPASRTSDEFIETDDHQVGQTWLPLLGYFLAAIVVAVLVVLGARAIYHAVKNEKKTPTTTVNPTSPPQIPSGNQPGSPSPSPPNPNKPKNTAPSPSPSPSSLPNNGPGDVIALFVGTSLAAAGLHYIVTVRRNT